MQHVCDSYKYLYFPTAIEKKIMRRRKLSERERGELFHERFSGVEESPEVPRLLDQYIEERVSRQLIRLEINLADEGVALTSPRRELVGKLRGAAFGDAAEEALSQLVSEVMLSIFSGEGSGDNRELTLLKVFYKVVDSLYIEEIRGKLNPLNIQRLSIRRIFDPLSTSALIQQFHLFRVVREARVWAEENIQLEPFCHSKERNNSKKCLCTNEIFKIGGESEESCIAYLKRGKGSQSGPSIMESLIWECALIMGMEHYFVPTKRIEIKTAVNKLSGSIQPAQKEEFKFIYFILNNAIERSLLNKEKIGSALLISLVMGMNDLHAGNLIYTNEGDLKFFDNTRTLVNSNGFIRRDTVIFIHSYRCCLMDLKKTREELSGEELERLKGELSHYSGKIPYLEKYLKGRRGNELIKGLPKGWLDVENALSAMRERVERMVGAMERGEIKTLLDLVDSAHPDYRFAYAIAYLEDRFKEEKFCSEFYFSLVGFYCKTVLTVNKCSMFGIDLSEIERVCCDRSLTYEEIKRRVESLYEKRDPLNIEIAKSNEAIKRRLLKESTLDLKDCPSNTYDRYISDIYFFPRNIETVVINPDENFTDLFYCFNHSQKNHLLLIDSEKTRLLYKTKRGCEVVELEFLYPPGRMRVDEQEVAIEEYLDRLLNDSL